MHHPTDRITHMTACFLRRPFYYSKYTHTHAYTRTHTRTHTHTCTQTQTHTQSWNTGLFPSKTILLQQVHTHTHTHTHKHTSHTHHTHTHTHKHTRTHARDNKLATSDVRVVCVRHHFIVGTSEFEVVIEELLLVGVVDLLEARLVAHLLEVPVVSCHFARRQVLHHTCTGKTTQILLHRSGQVRSEWLTCTFRASFTADSSF